MSKHEFKVGDRVRVLSSVYESIVAGDESVVVEVDNELIGLRWGGDRLFFYPRELSLIEPSKRKWAHSRKKVLKHIEGRIADHSLDSNALVISALKDILVLLAEEAE